MVYDLPAICLQLNRRLRGRCQFLVYDLTAIDNYRALLGLIAASLVLPHYVNLQ